jgi:uncharacterized membrane protein YjjP (DUF1212 family)
MAETYSRSRSGRDSEEIRLLIQFMSEIGAAMNGAGEATTFVRRSLQRIGRAYGLHDVAVFAVPTLLLVRYGDDQSTFLDLSSQIPIDLRLDQTAALYTLIDDANDARVSPRDGMARLRQIVASGPRFNLVTRLLGFVLLTAGIALVLGPTAEELAIAVALAVVVSVIRETVGRWRQLWPVLPPAAGLIVSATVFLLIGQGVEVRPLLVVVATLTTFLPGAALTTAMIELSNGDLIAGGSRLAYGVARLFLLVFGVITASQWFEPPPEAIEEDLAGTRVGEMALVGVAGLVAFTLGIFLHFSAPRGSLLWLLVVVCAAWVGQQVGGFFLGGYLSGFVGAALMVVVARIISQRRGAPPLIVSYTPAFWILVPGALGLEGLAQMVYAGGRGGFSDLLAMVVTMVSIALGVLFALIVSGSRSATEPY